MPPPRLYLDEDVTPRVAEALRKAGFDAIQATEVERAQRGISDEEQLAFAVRHRRAIFSYNYVEFEDLAKRWVEQSRHHWGIVVSPRQYSLRRLNVLVDQLQAFLRAHDADDLRDQFRFL